MVYRHAVVSRKNKPMSRCNCTWEKISTGSCKFPSKQCLYICIMCNMMYALCFVIIYVYVCVRERESMRACVSRARCKLIPFYYVMLCFGEFQHSVTWTFLLSGNQRTSFTTGTQRERDFCLSFSLLTPTTAYLCSHADKLMYTVQLFQDHFVSL